MYHLAQINIALAVDDMDSPVMQGFVSRLDEINGLAEQSDGFIWRLKDDNGGNDATNIQAFENPRILVNISVWRDLPSLQQFVYKSVHVELIRDRSEWFHKIKEMHQALWWVPAGHVPTVEEAKTRLEHLREHGPSQQAFTFAKPFQPI